METQFGSKLADVSACKVNIEPMFRADNQNSKIQSDHFGCSQ